MIRHKARKPVYGVGINDADYVTQPKDRGLRCPIFDRWHSMIRRCYSENSRIRNPSYEMVTVCQDWLVYSNFKIWMESQTWKGLALDKDILGDGNLYAPGTCAFVPQDVNSFFAESTQSEFPGTRLKFEDGRSRPYIAQIHANGKKRHLGVYASRVEGHKAWQIAKLEELERLISEHKGIDCRVFQRMNSARQRVANDIEFGKITRSLK